MYVRKSAVKDKWAERALTDDDVIAYCHDVITHCRPPYRPSIFIQCADLTFCDKVKRNLYKCSVKSRPSTLLTCVLISAVHI